MSNTGLYESDSEPEGTRYGDSDEESLVDVDSPADGYFERREHPQTTFIPHPATQSSRSEEDKAREAAAERRGHQQHAGTSGRPEGTERQSPPSHHSQPRSPVWTADENTPLLDAGPAGPPPDYAAATADRRHRREGSGGSYGSLSDSAFSADHPLVRNGLMSEQGVFGHRSEPQSMRDTPAPSPHGEQRTGLRGGGEGEVEGEQGARHGVDEEGGFIRRQWDRDWNGRRRWTRHFKRKRVVTWVLVIGTLLFILLLSGIFEDAQDNGGYPSGGNGRNNPEKPPSAPDDGDDVSTPSDPTKDSPMPPHKATAQCPYRSFSVPENRTFSSSKQFSLLEFIEGKAERSFFNDRITGTIQVAAAPPSQTDAIVVWMSVAISGPMEIGRHRIVRDEEGMGILFPEVEGDVNRGNSGDHSGRWYGEADSCMDFSVGVLIKPGLNLKELDIDTANLDVQIEHGLFDYPIRTDDNEKNKLATTALADPNPTFAHIDTISITAVRGKVHADYLASRSTYIETTSSRISGTYALRDSLTVKSQSGAIAVDVVPKAASEEDPSHPADFRVSSNSGKVEVGFLTDGIGGEELPKRDYHVKVSTLSSAIKGSYILGAEAKFESLSGAVDVSVLPFYADKASELHTSSGSAQTRLRLLSPYTTSTSSSPYHMDKSAVLGHLHSTHKAYSGSLQLTYPSGWEGVIDGESVSGKIQVRGEDVEMLVDRDLGDGVPRYGKGRGKSVLRHVTARKGTGESRLGFETTSGRVDVLVGRE